MASMTPIRVSAMSQPLDELGFSLGLPPCQILAAVDLTISFGKTDATPRQDKVAQLDYLVRECAGTGCPPCMRRMAEGLSPS